MIHRKSIAGAMVMCMMTSSAWGDPPTTGPSNVGVLLPPQATDVPVKMPNIAREPSGEWSISGGVYLIQPVFGSNPAFIVKGAALTRTTDFNSGLNIAPNAWLGYTSERGWGFRGRWFQYDHGNSSGYAAAPGETITGITALGLGQTPINGTINAYSNLAVNVADIQATCTMDSARWWHLFAVGVRYAHLNQDYRATLTNANTDLELTSVHNFNGAGPSFSLETKRRLGESGFAVYGQIHGAILFGNARELASAINNGVPQDWTHGLTRVIPVGELEIGADYAHNLGKVKLFVQAGFLGQIWFGAGNASNLDTPGFASASNTNFGFVGIALRAGVHY